MANEYLIPLGADLGPLINDIRELTGESSKLNASLKASGEATKKAFTEANAAQNSFTQSTIEANKQAKQQANEMKTLNSLVGGYSDSVKEVEISQAALNKELSKGVDAAKKQLSGLKEGSKEYNKLAKEIQAAEVGLASLNGKAGDTDKKFEKMKKTLADNKAILQQLAAQGLQNTKVFKDLEKQTGELDDTIRDVNEAIKLAGSDTKGLDNLIGSATALTGAFSVAQGAVALFGQESEDIQKALLKVNAAMSILNGLQAIQSELKRKDSLVSRAAAAGQAAYATVVGTSTGALKLFRLALASTGIGLLVIGLGYLIANFDKVKEKVLDLFPGLGKLAGFISDITQKFTDFVGITSETERSVDRVAKAFGRVNDNIDFSIRKLEAQGGKEQEIFKKKEERIQNEIGLLNVRRMNGQKLTEEQLANEIKLNQDLEILALEKEKFTQDQQKKSSEERDKERKAQLAKEKEANDKALAIQKEFNSKQLALDKQFRDLKIASIQDDTEQLIAAEDAKLADLKAQAQSEVDQFKGTAEQKKSLQEAANKVIEQLYVNHYFALSKIAKDGYNADLAEKQKALDAETAIVDAQFEKDVESTTKRVEVAKKAAAKTFDIFKMANDGLTELLKDAGFDDAQSAEIISTAKKTFDGILDAYTESIDAQIEAKQRQVEALTDQISEVEDELNREQELQKDGYANNVEAKKAEIEALKAEREKQLEDERKLQKERAKLASLDIAIATIQQTTTLTLAAAELFKNAAKSSLNPILGVILGIAAAGSMFAGFQAIKSKLKASQDAVPKFREGGVFDVLKGKASHESRGVSLVDNNGDQLAEFEGDEKLFIVNKGSSSKHEDLLRAINDDDFSKLRENNGSLRQLLKQIGGVHFIEDAPYEVLSKQRKVQSMGIASAASLSGYDLSALPKLLEEVREFKTQEKERLQVYDYGDHIVERKGSFTKKIRKPKNDK